ncbi:MAG: tRNA pseudouridine13 synthase [Gammaproteobacteria bacterium]
MNYPYGDPDITGVIKTQPEDFRVTENLGFEPCGEGEHLFLHIEKNNLTTQDLVEQVAQEFSVKQRDVGYSGLKDKLAITRQWLSVHLPGQMSSLEIQPSSAYNLLQSGWHNKKIRPGSHRSNSFDVTVRNVAELSSQTLQQIDSIRQHGIANYFGVQRFGQQQDNVDRAIHSFSNERRARKLSRTKRSLYISALRSYLFNQVLSRRIELGHWSRPIPGDVFMLSGSHSIFCEPLSDEIIDRYQKQDLSSTVSLLGTGNRQLEGEALLLEDAVLAQFEAMTQCLIEQKSKLQMRTTRISVEDFSVEYDHSAEDLTIKATLPSGCYFTTLLAHFVNT